MSSEQQGADLPEVEVRYADLALARIAAAESQAVPGVVRMQRARLGVTRRTSGDVSAVDVSAAPDGSLDVAVRVVVRLEPQPAATIRAVTDAVADRLQAVTGLDVRVEVTVVDVEA